MCEGTCAPTGCQTGRKKRSHGVRGLFRMGILAGGSRSVDGKERRRAELCNRPQVRSEESDERKKPMHIRHICLASGRNPNAEHNNGTIQYLVRSYRGLERVDTTHIALYRINFLVAPSARA